MTLLSKTLLSKPAAIRLRPQEALLWQGQPGWRVLAERVFHIRIVALWVCALVFANAVAARAMGLDPWVAVQDIVPVLILGGLVVVATGVAAWATARTTRYSITSQRVVLQYGVALTATLALPMRLIASVGVSDGAVGDVLIPMKPGKVIGFIKLWPHARPWRLMQPQPMLRAVTDAGAVAALLSRTVEAAQRVELARVPEALAA